MKRDPTLQEYRSLRCQLAATRRELREAWEVVKTLDQREDDLLGDMDEVWDAMSQAERDEHCARPQELPAP